MATTAKEIKRRSRKLIQLPSGIQVEIRKLWLSDFMGAGELPLPQSTTESDQAGKLRQQDIINYSTRAIVHGVVAPKFSDRLEDEGLDDIAHVRDLSQEDFSALAMAIFEWSGLGKEVAAEAESFRADGLGENSGRNSAEIRETPERDPEADASGVLSEFGDSLSQSSRAEKTS